MTSLASPASASRPIRRGLLFTGIAAAAIVGYTLVLWVVPPAVDRALPSGPALSVAIQQTFNALSIGSIYALIALGYTMVYGIIELINFAHGDIFMVGAFVSVIFIGGIMGQTGAVDNIPFLVLLILGALVFTMPLIGLLNVSIERLVLPAAPERAQARAADHRDRRLVHPPERRARHRRIG